MEHKDGELIIVRKDFLSDNLVKHLNNNLFPRRRTCYFHRSHLFIIFADDLVNLMPDVIFLDLYLNLNRKTTFFHHKNLDVRRSNIFDSIRRNY